MQETHDTKSPHCPFSLCSLSLILILLMGSYGPDKGEDAVVLRADVLSVVARGVNVVAHTGPVFPEHVNALQQRQHLLVAPLGRGALRRVSRIHVLQWQEESGGLDVRRASRGCQEDDSE